MSSGDERNEQTTDCLNTAEAGADPLREVLAHPVIQDLLAAFPGTRITPIDHVVPSDKTHDRAPARPPGGGIRVVSRRRAGSETLTFSW